MPWQGVTSAVEASFIDLCGHSHYFLVLLLRSEVGKAGIESVIKSFRYSEI